MTESGSANDAATALLHSSMPLCETLGMRGIRSDPDHVEIALDWDASLCTVNGMMHGGAWRWPTPPARSLRS